MDKNKIIDDILNEWAMRSHDGLVSGHDTPENMATLNEILSERGEVNRIDLFKNKAKTGTKIEPNKASTIKNEPQWTVEYLVEQKTFNRPSAITIIEAIRELNPTDRKEFLYEKFDRLSADQAITFLNKKGTSYSAFLDALDKARKAKGKSDDDDEGDVSGSKAGRGEFILVLLIQGGKSAGAASGDIILPSGESIEVKEVKDSGESFRATRASFGGQFNKIPYIDAVNELVAFCSGNQERAGALIELTENGGVKDGEGSGKGKKRKELTYLKAFFTNPSIESINTSIVYGLEKLGSHIRSINKKEAEKQIMDPDKVEFDIGKETSILKMDVGDTTPEDLQKIKNPPKEPETISVTVSSIAQEQRRAELIIPQIKRLKFFRYEKKSMDDVFTPENIAKSMFEAMSTPPGHYTGGIIFYNSKTGIFTYEKDLTKLKNGAYYFYGYQQTGPTFTKSIKT